MLALASISLWIIVGLMLVYINDNSDDMAILIGLWLLLGWLFSGIIVYAIQLAFILIR